MTLPVLPPPPSTPDDGPEGLDVPPLGRPPIGLAALARSQGSFGFPLRTWAAFVTLFALGSVVTFLIQR
jgi:hypothetical protein